jgi:hypothetical protein
MRYFVYALTASAITLAMFATLVLQSSGEGIVIHPDVPDVVAFCDTPSSWTVVVNEGASAESIQAVESLAAQHCATFAK